MCRLHWHAYYYMCVYCVENVLTVNSINIYSIDGMVKKPSVSAFQNFLWIKDQLNIKKVMGRNVWMCFVLTALTYVALNALEILMPYVDSVDIYSIWGHWIQSRVFTPHYSVYSVAEEPQTPVLTVLTKI